MSWEVRTGDVLDRLREMPDCSVQCAVTSAPYWGLRDYGVTGVAANSILIDLCVQVVELLHERFGEDAEADVLGVEHFTGRHRQQYAVLAQHRASTVSGIDRRVCLEVVPAVQGLATRGHDPLGDGVGKS